MALKCIDALETAGSQKRTVVLSTEKCPVRNVTAMSGLYVSLHSLLHNRDEEEYAPSDFLFFRMDGFKRVV
jgi:hypothetical protein